MSINGGSRSGETCGTGADDEFPGAVRPARSVEDAECGSEPLAELVAGQEDLEESVSVAWWRRIPTARRMMVFSSIVFILAMVCFAVGSVYIQQLPESTAAGLGVFSEALSSALGGSPGKRVFEGRDRLNILCIGVDYNRDSKGIGYTKGARSDTIFVLSIDSKGQILNILSIPRDSRVFINEAVGYDKINAAYQEGGIELCKRVVSEFLGVPIHHYVIVKVAGAGKMVDALGGLQVDVEKDMDYDDNWGGLHIHLKKGNQLLNGEQAVGYARFRMDAESDRGRIRRQQQVMMSLVRRLKDPMVVLRLQSIVKAVKENVETDLSVMDMLDLTYLYKDFDRKFMKTGAIVGDDADIDGVSYVIPIDAENQRIIRALLKDPGERTRQELRVEVVNACGDETVFGDVVSILQDEGIQVVRVRDAEELSDVTAVVDHVGCGVRTIFESLLGGCMYDVVEDDGAKKQNGESAVDLTVIVGTDRLIARDRAGQAAAARGSYSEGGYDSSSSWSGSYGESGSSGEAGSSGEDVWVEPEPQSDYPTAAPAEPRVELPYESSGEGQSTYEDTSSQGGGGAAAAPSEESAPEPAPVPVVEPEPVVEAPLPEAAPPTPAGGEAAAE